MVRPQACHNPPIQQPTPPYISIKVVICNNIKELWQIIIIIQIEKIINHNSFGLILIITTSLVIQFSSLYYPSACLNPHWVLVVDIVVVVCINRAFEDKIDVTRKIRYKSTSPYRLKKIRYNNSDNNHNNSFESTRDPLSSKYWIVPA